MLLYLKVLQVCKMSMFVFAAAAAGIVFGLFQG